MTAKEGNAACERIMRHSQGPWHYNESLSRDCNQLVYGPDGYIVANVGSLKMSMQVQEATAKLIAAAPDMIDALISISPIVDTFINQTPSGEARNHLTDLNILIKSAIDKATKP